MEKSSPTNTSEQAKKDPLSFLGLALITGSSAAIENQEAQGQRELVKSSVLPTDIRAEDKTALESAGVKFGELVPDDTLFQYVEFPAGWKLQPSDHSMWSYLLDDKGRRRAGVFYKAAFYDRKSHLRCESRYRYNYDYNREKAEGVAVSRAMDGETVIFSTDPAPVNKERSWESSDAANTITRAWLDTNYPDWRNPAAYWD